MRKILYLTCFCLLSASYAAFAQQDINSTVEVKREFEGRLMEIAKSKLNTRYSDTLLNLNLNFDYSIFERQYKDLYEFTPMPSPQVADDAVIQYPVLFSKLSMAYPWMPKADIYFQPRLGERFSLLAYYNHSSFWGNLPLKVPFAEGSTVMDSEWRGDRNINKGGIAGAYSWRSGRISIGADYSNNHYAYYYPLQYDVLDDFYHTFDILSANMDLRSTNSDATSFLYEFTAKYDMVRDKQGTSEMVREHSIEGGLLLGAVLRKKHKFLLEVNSLAVSNKTLQGFVEFAPQYRLDSRKWKVVWGVNFAFPYSNVAEKSDVASVYPLLSASFEAVKELLWLYAEVDGENDYNSYLSLIKVNPWLSPDLFYSNTAVPLRAKAGLQGKVRDKFSYSVYGAYKIVRYMPMFYSDGIYPKKYVKYIDNEVASAGIDLMWKSKDVEAMAGFNYNRYLKEVVYMLPTFEAKGSFIYNYRQRFFMGLDLRYRNSVLSSISLNGENVRVPAFVDLGLNITYSMNSKLSFFIQGNNLLNRDIQYVENYAEPGINFGLGVYFKL